MSLLFYAVNIFITTFYTPGERNRIYRSVSLLLLTIYASLCLTYFYEESHLAF